MRNRHFALLCLIAILFLAPWSMSQTQPHEHFQNAEVIYGWAHDSAGHKLRTLVTRPRNATGKVPAIFFVGWLSCDSVEYPQGETDGFAAIFWRLIEQSGYATMRMDKPGVGESQGDINTAARPTVEPGNYIVQLNRNDTTPYHVDLSASFTIS